MPNSASYEREFFKLEWLSGKYRINLSTQSLESLAKMNSYYLSNLKKELAYYGQNVSIEEIVDIIHSLDSSEIEEMDKDSNSKDLNIINDKSNNNVEVIIEWYSLHMENFIDLSDKIFTKDIEII
ncbi:ribonuclease H-like domain-containing protein [Rhizophagus clarus]|uniref:Ribonuclease H-like domain-containing protein n=2 Tax=Rhizophagus clarus TaxID=94130 RepID=A0A8H3M552_9GLOM|nr:ribonuclease H-like domain-containing protein [Rhizophagus clarus]